MNMENVFVFLVPIFIATIVNNSQKKALRPNLKIVFYKFFVLLAILFISSQIKIGIVNQRSLLAIRIIGNSLMFALILEFFLIPTSNNKNPDEIIVVHTTILWISALIFLFFSSYFHFNNISYIDNKWGELNPITDILKIIHKIFNDVTLPSLHDSDTTQLPFCNLFN